MGTPYTHDPILITVPAAGNAHGFVLRVPRRGSIRRLRLVQLGGTTAGFSYILFSRYEAMRALVVADWGAGDEGSSAGETPGESAIRGGALPGPPDKIKYGTDADADASLDEDWDDAKAPLYQIAPTRTVDSGDVVDDPDGFGLDLAYTNKDFMFRDGTPARSVNMPSYLYLVVTVAGAGTDVPFGLDICVDDPSTI